VPVLGRRRQSQPVAADLIGNIAKPAGKGLTLAIGVGSRDQNNTRARGQLANGRFCRRRPPAPRAEIEAAVTQLLKSRKAHGVDRRFGDAKTRGIGRTKAKQNFRTACGKAIEERDRPPEPGDDILLSVITDGRHAAIDLRFVMPATHNEEENKLNLLVCNAYRIWKQTSEIEYVRPDGKPYDLPGAAQMIFSDLGTINVEKSRGFSAYRFIRDELIRFGVPASQIAFMQDYKKTEAKQRLFGDVRAGKVRFLIGSSETMGTGVNAQLRLKALHHLDVPWLPSQIEQREGRIVRQGNQHEEVDIFAYATEGSLDASMWQNNERKARFIAAALSGDTSTGGYR
jgi:hypothetical protein